MVHSVYEHLKGCIGEPSDVIYKKLDEINCRLFEPLWNEPDVNCKAYIFNRDEAATIILYIIYAYSQHSDWLIIGADSAEEKVGIAERINMPEFLYQKVIKLQSSIVRKVVVHYLNTQSSRAFKYLSFKKDMYEAAMDNGIMSLTDKEGKVDLKAMSDADKYMKSLLEEMRQFEDELRAEYKFVYENKLDIEDAEAQMKKRGNLSGNVEGSKEIT